MDNKPTSLGHTFVQTQIRPVETVTQPNMSVSNPQTVDPELLTNPVEPAIPTTPPATSDAEWKAKIEKQKQEVEAAKLKNKLATELENDLNKIDKAIDILNTKQVPTSDTKRSKAKNASVVLFTDLGTEEEFKQTFEAEQAADTRPKEVQEEDPKQELVELAMCEQLGMRTKQQRLLTKFINAIDKNTEEVSKLKQAVKELGLSKIKPNIPTSDGPKVLTGDAALATVIARTKGVFRIPLYNSGFWVSVKPPTMSELDAFIHEVDMDFKEFGRILGSHYHLIFNILIKQKLMELLYNNIINSNFDNFKNKIALFDAISLQDYETIAWAFCTMMYSDGINIGVYCTNPECRNKDTSQFVDLAKCNYMNHDVFNKDAINWMMEGFNPKTIRTLKDIMHYRTNVIKGSKTIKDDTGANVYTLEVPSMNRFFTIGTELFTNIVETVHGEKNINKEQLANEITYTIYKMLTPWIAKLTMMDNGVTQFITADSRAIMESLDIGYGENSTVYQQVEDFVKDTRICYFGATSLKCPKCGKVPNFSKNNMFTFDMEQVFFGLSYLLLGRVGETL